MASNVQHKGTEKLQCDQCKICINTATVCIHCDIPKCQNCCTIHKGLKKQGTVVLEHLQKHQNEDTDDKCDIHVSQDLIFYCESCNFCVCETCVEMGHFSHSVTKVKDIVQVFDQKLSEVLASIRYTQIPQIRSKVKLVNSNKEENKKQGEIAEENINARMDDLVQEINKLREKLIDESKELQMINEEHLNEVETLLTADLEQLELLYNECKQVLVSGSDVQKIKSELSVSSDLDELLSHDTDIVLSFPLFYKGDIDIKYFQKAYGFIDTKIVSSTEFESNIFSIDEANVDIISSFNHKSKDILSILTFSDDTAWVHCRGEFNNEEIDNNGKIRKVLTFSYMVNDLAYFSEEEIFVGAGNTTFIYKMTKDNKMTGCIDTSPLQCLCLCVSRHENILAGLVDKWSFSPNDDSRRLVARMTRDGEIMETYEYEGQTRLFVLLWGIAENKNGHICVVNKISMATGHLVILDASGKLKITYKGNHSDKHFDATDVTCDKLGFILVSDCRNRKIHLLNETGQLIQYLLTSKDLLYNPDALCLDSRGYLWIGCHGGQILQIKYLD